MCAVGSKEIEARCCAAGKLEEPASSMTAEVLDGSVGEGSCSMRFLYGLVTNWSWSTLAFHRAFGRTLGSCVAERCVGFATLVSRMFESGRVVRGTL